MVYEILNYFRGIPKQPIVGTFDEEIETSGIYEDRHLLLRIREYLVDDRTDNEFFNSYISNNTIFYYAEEVKIQFEEQDLLDVIPEFFAIGPKDVIQNFYEETVNLSSIQKLLQQDPIKYAIQSDTLGNSNYAYIVLRLPDHLMITTTLPARLKIFCK